MRRIRFVIVVMLLGLGFAAELPAPAKPRLGPRCAPAVMSP